MSDANEPTSWDPTAKSAPKPMGFFKELLVFSWENKWWWITPTLLILVGLTAMVFMAQGSMVAPFFYALF